MEFKTRSGKEKEGGGKEGRREGGREGRREGRREGEGVRKKIMIWFKKKKIIIK